MKCQPFWPLNDLYMSRFVGGDLLITSKLLFKSMEMMNDFERLVGFSRPHLLIENGKGYLSLNEIRLVSSRLVSSRPIPSTTNSRPCVL